MHNGYGYFLASELVPWGGQNSRYSEAERAAMRKSLSDGTRDENADKDEMRIGGATNAKFATAAKPSLGCPTISAFSSRPARKAIFASRNTACSYIATKAPRTSR